MRPLAPLQSSQPASLLLLLLLLPLLCLCLLLLDLLQGRLQEVLQHLDLAACVAEQVQGMAGAVTRGHTRAGRLLGTALMPLLPRPPCMPFHQPLCQTTHL